jgi:hypothetical protein
MKKLLPLLLAVFAGCDTTLDLVCPSGGTACGGHCVALATDPNNCGGCGAVVGALEVCLAGVVACAPLNPICDGACTDVAHDPANCGDCAVACGATQYCTTGVGASTCTDVCAGGLTACGRACVDVAADRSHCGGCGVRCATGQACRAGVCTADIYVACYATTEVMPVTADLAPAGSAARTAGGPIALAVGNGAVYSANGWPGSVSILPFDGSTRTVVANLGGDDAEGVVLYQNALLVSNADLGTVAFLSASGSVIGEVAMPAQQWAPTPFGIAVEGGRAYVALAGKGGPAGQSVAVLDLSGLGACAAGAAPCATVEREIDLLSVPGAADAPGLPFPADVATHGGRVFVSLNNRKQDGSGYYVQPAGSGRLAMIDPAADHAVSIVDLGSECGNPGGMALHGSTLWIACGSWGYPLLAPSAVVPVDIASAAPTIGTPIDMTGIVPGKLAFCGGVGYVTDQASGQVVRFDPVSRSVESPVEVCPMTAGPYGYAWASDVACAP